MCHENLAIINKIALSIMFLIMGMHSMACRKKSPVKGSLNKQQMLFIFLIKSY